MPAPAFDPTLTDRLIITNGDGAVEAVRATGIQADVLPWRDVLHDGPVPAGLDPRALSARRAQYLTRLGWGGETELATTFRDRDRVMEQAPRYREVVLWFERDLYDQLQLLQVLSELDELDALPPTLTLIQSRSFITETTPEINRYLFETRAVAGRRHLELAREGWAAFREPSPLHLQAFAARPGDAFPFMTPALHRFFEEYPAPTDGLGRSHRQILELVAGGIDRPVPLFKEASRREPDPYLGDYSFWQYVEHLVACDEPAVRRAEGEAFVHPPACEPDDAFREQRLTLTPFGQAILNGQTSFLTANRFERWLGGVHLRPGHYWSWDPVARRFHRIGIW